MGKKGQRGPGPGNGIGGSAPEAAAAGKSGSRGGLFVRPMP